MQLTDYRSRPHRVRRNLRSRLKAKRNRKRSARCDARLGVESLERRWMLSANLLTDGCVSGTDAASETVGVDQVASTSGEAVLWDGHGGREAVAEGEDTPQVDLVGFAQALAAAEDVKLFGGAWCASCTEQKEMFEDGGQFLPFIEVTSPDQTPNEIADTEGITTYPTWEFPDGSREEGVLSLETIASRSDVAIPTSTSPFVAPIEDQTVLDGSPLHVGLDGYDSNGGPLTFTVASSDPSVVQPTVLSGNRSASIRFADWGEMVFELFEQRVPRAAGRFIELAQSGFYDAATNDPDITAHRVIDNFMFQFGDPTGTGSGGSSLPDFDDQFHPELQHNTPGILSWAKSSDDTNDSQVFVTDVPTRHLDFNHSVFGMLTEEDGIRDAITKTATDENNRPENPVKLDSVEIFEDTENGTLMLEAGEGASGSATITVTVTDEDGNSHEETFDVTVQEDTVNGGPYLEELSPVTTVMDSPASFQLSAVDVEGDDVQYGGSQVGSVDYTIDVDSEAGEVSVTPPAGFIGEMDVLVYTRPASSADTSDVFDTQRVSVTVAPPAPENVDLPAASDSGVSDSDDITNITDLEFQVDVARDGATVKLYHGETVLGQTTADGSSATISTSSLAGLGDGTYELTAVQVVDGLESAASTPLEVTLDTTAPPEFTSTPPGTASVGELFSYDAENPEEGTSGAVYSVTGGLDGVSVDPDTGVVSWTPTAGQLGTHQLSVVLTDAAGNSRSQDIELEVEAARLVDFRVEVTDSAGVEISSVSVGDEFDLRVYVEDSSSDPRGVFSAYADLLYNESLVAADGELEYGSEYPNNREGELTSGGLIDEVGAFAGTQELGGGEFLLFKLSMQAIHGGTAVFESEAADELPAHELLRFGGDFHVQPEEVQYGATSLTIDAAFGANDDIFNVDEDSGVTGFDVLNNDEAFEGSTGEFTIVDVTGTSQTGTASIAADGNSIEYTPGSDFFGEETFSYTVSDGTGTDTALVTVQVMPTNDDPTANPDEVVVVEDSTEFSIDVLDNDSIAPDENETLSVVDFDSLSAGGSLSIAPEANRLLYTPAQDFFGTETFNYTIEDGNGGTDTATVTVTVTAENDPPEAVDDTVEAVEDSTDNVLDVLDNDTTAGDADETLTIVEVSEPDQGGTVSISEDELTVVYTPEPDFYGDEQFTYEITDGNGGFAEATVTVTVSGTNDPPAAQDDTFTVVKNETEALLTTLENDSSAPDGTEELVVSGVGETSEEGTVVVADDGQGILYSPAADFTGEETFTYTIEDPDGATAQATVTVTVLDYIPSNLSGHVYLDVDNDGAKDGTETPLGGIVVTLRGTDMFGDPVEREETTNAMGYYQFQELVPGSYELVETQPQFLIDGTDRAGNGGEMVFEPGVDVLPIELEQDADVTGFDFGERGREPARTTIVDLFASSRTEESVLLAADAHEESHWYAVERGWSGTASLDVQFNGDMAGAQLDLTTTDARQCSTQLDMTSRGHVLRLIAGEQEGLWRVSESRDQLFPPEDTGSTSSGESCSEDDCGCAPAGGEGEADAARVVTNAMDTGAMDAEGEATSSSGTTRGLAAKSGSQADALSLGLGNETSATAGQTEEEGQVAKTMLDPPSNAQSATDLLLADPTSLFASSHRGDQGAFSSPFDASVSEGDDDYKSAIDLLMSEAEMEDALRIE